MRRIVLVTVLLALLLDVSTAQYEDADLVTESVANLDDSYRDTTPDADDAFSVRETFIPREVIEMLPGGLKKGLKAPKDDLFSIEESESGAVHVLSPGEEAPQYNRFREVNSEESKAVAAAEISESMTSAAREAAHRRERSRRAKVHVADTPSDMSFRELRAHARHAKVTPITAAAAKAARQEDSAESSDQNSDSEHNRARRVGRLNEQQEEARAVPDNERSGFQRQSATDVAQDQAAMRMAQNMGQADVPGQMMTPGQVLEQNENAGSAFNMYAPDNGQQQQQLQYSMPPMASAYAPDPNLQTMPMQANQVSAPETYAQAPRFAQAQVTQQQQPAMQLADSSSQTNPLPQSVLAARMARLQRRKMADHRLPAAPRFLQQQTQAGQAAPALPAQAPSGVAFSQPQGLRDMVSGRAGPPVAPVFNSVPPSMQPENNIDMSEFGMLEERAKTKASTQTAQQQKASASSAAMLKEGAAMIAKISTGETSKLPQIQPVHHEVTHGSRGGAPSPPAFATGPFDDTPVQAQPKGPTQEQQEEAADRSAIFGR